MKEYYNVLESGYGILGFASYGIILSVIGITAIFFMKRNGVKRYKIIFTYFLTGFAILWTIIVFIVTGSEYLSCRSAMKDGSYSEVEGVVENFDPMPYAGHKDESFTVKGVTFKYSDFGPSAGFNKTKSHGGPIDEGKYVRIKYYEGKILQLWVKE